MLCKWKLQLGDSIVCSVCHYTCQPLVYFSQTHNPLDAGFYSWNLIITPFPSHENCLVWLETSIHIFELETEKNLVITSHKIIFTMCTTSAKCTMCYSKRVVHGESIMRGMGKNPFHSNANFQAKKTWGSFMVIFNYVLSKFQDIPFPFFLCGLDQVPMFRNLKCSLRVY